MEKTRFSQGNAHEMFFDSQNFDCFSYSKEGRDGAILEKR